MVKLVLKLCYVRRYIIILLIIYFGFAFTLKKMLFTSGTTIGILG